ncbi:MAG: VPLPA-CTERM sorting domain-containing protein [Pseudomonadota bacterium]
MTFKTITAATALGLASILPAQAATFDITGTVLNGIFAGETGSGTVTFDETLLLNTGFEQLAPVGTTLIGALEDATLQIDFELAGVTYVETNDVGFPNFPTLDFEDGSLDFIDFVLEDGVNGVDFSGLGVLAAIFVDNLLFDAASNSFTVGIGLEYATPVPLPAGLPLLLAGLGALGVARRFQS